MVNKSSRKQKKSGFSRVAECVWRNNKTQIYYAVTKRGGKQFKRSLRTNDRAIAVRLAADFRRQVGTLNLRMEAGSITFAELARDWMSAAKVRLKEKSAARLEGSVKNLVKFFGIHPVRSITTTMCRHWETQRGQGISASTFNQEKGPLRRIFEHAVAEGLVFENPARHLKHRKLARKLIVIPTHEQFRLLVETIRQAGPRARTGADLAELLAYSGMRLAEATALVWADIDTEREVFHVTGGDYGTKNREVRTVPLFPALKELFKRLRQERNPDSGDRVVPIVTARKAISNACAKAKLPYFHHHTLRHYFISNAIEAGVNFKVIANWVGHKDGGVLVAKTYGHLRDSHSFDMAQRMTFSAI